MRGIGSTFSRLPSVAAWLAGAAMLAGAMAPPAQAQSEETAMAIPRLAPLGGDGVVLPQPLATPDAAVLRRLFADPAMDQASLLQLSGELDPADRVAAEVLGHVLAERYMRQPRRVSAAELAAWLDHYSGLPDGAAVQDLLHRANPAASEPADHSRVPEATSLQRHALLRAEKARALFAGNRDAAALALASSAAREGGVRSVSPTTWPGSPRGGCIGPTRRCVISPPRRGRRSPMPRCAPPPASGPRGRAARGAS